MAKGKLIQYGYGSKSVGNVQLPDKIKCVRCRVIKGPGAFATNRQNDLKDKIKNDRNFNAINPGYIPCLQCTQVGGNVVELLCNKCNKVKGKDSFSKSQRKNPDKAECWACLEARLNTEPGGGSGEDSSNSNDEDEDGSDCSDDFGTVTNSVQGLSIGGGSVGASSTSGYETYPSKVDTSSGGVPLSSRRLSDTDSMAGSVADSNVTDRTPKLAPHLRSKAPSSVAGSDFSISSTSNFAKIRAAPQKIKMDAAQRVRDQDKAAEDDVRVATSDSDSD